MKELADTAKDGAAELRTDSVRNSGRGRPPIATSGRTIAEQIGIPRQTIRDAEQHVAAVEAFPDLEPLPQSRANARQTACEGR